MEQGAWLSWNLESIYVLVWQSYEVRKDIPGRERNSICKEMGSSRAWCLEVCKWFGVDWIQSTWGEVVQDEFERVVAIRQHWVLRIRNGNSTCGISLASVCHRTWEELRKPGVSNVARWAARKAIQSCVPRWQANSVIMGEESRIIMAFFSRFIMEPFLCVIALTATDGMMVLKWKFHWVKCVKRSKENSNSRKSFELNYCKDTFHISISA